MEIGTIGAQKTENLLQVIGQFGFSHLVPFRIDDAQHAVFCMQIDSTVICSHGDLLVV